MKATYENSESIVTLTYESSESKIARLTNENTELKIELAVERKNRYNLEKINEELQSQITELKELIPKTRAKKGEKTYEEYSEFKTDGKRKARPAEAIRSYEDFVSIQNYFLNKNDIRDWAMWTMGVSLGLRVSDLLSLKFKNLLNEDKTFRKRITIIEHKTHKANQCLITESVKFALEKFMNSINYQFQFDDYIFKSGKTKSKMTEEYGWMILSNAGKALNLPIVIGSHTMRKSFANIAACVDKSSIDMNAITKVQGLLNHSDQKVTMKYLGTFMKMYDNARRAVSDFVLGKTNVHEIVAGTNRTIDDIAEMLERLLQASALE